MGSRASIALLAAVALGLAAGCAGAPTPRALNASLITSSRASDPSAVAERFLRAVEAQPTILAEIEGIGVWQLLEALESRGDRDAEIRVLETLAAHDWRPADEPWRQRPGVFDARLALRLIERGDVDAARVAARRIRSADTLIDVLIDRRYEPVWADVEAANPGGALAALEREIAELEAARAAHPRSLRVVTLEVEALHQAGRLNDAMRLAEATLAKLADAQGPAFDDADTSLNWFLNVVANALVRLDKASQAHATMDKAAGYPEHFGGTRIFSPAPNVSQAINGADLLVEDGRAEEAQRRLGGYTPANVSPYGWTAILSVRACAAAQLGDAAVLEITLAALRERRDDGSGPLQGALLCADRIDEAVETMVWRLSDEDAQAGALRALQRLKDPPHTLSYEAVLDERFEQVRNDPRVVEAAERAGRIMTWDITQR